MPTLWLTAPRLRCLQPGMFRGLNGHVPEQKSDLLQLTSPSVTELRVRPSQVIGSYLGQRPLAHRWKYDNRHPAAGLPRSKLDHRRVVNYS